MVQFMQMPAVRAPDNALLDLARTFQPITNGLANYTAGINNQAKMRDDQKLGQDAATNGPAAAAKTAYGMGRLEQGQQFQNQAQASSEKLAQKYGHLVVNMRNNMQPEQFAQAWPGVIQRMMRESGDAGQPDPEELDPTTGPDLLLAAAGMKYDPMAREASRVNLDKDRAQTDLYRAQAEAARTKADAPAKPNVGQQTLDREFAKEYNELVLGGGAADVQKNLTALKEVSGELKKKGGSSLTGAEYALTPEFMQDVAPWTAKGAAARQRVEEVVQRNLRVILGAQFTNEEGKRLIARAYNPNQSEAENAKRLDRLVTAMDAMLQAKLQAAQYFQSNNGTLAGYDGVANFRVSDLEAALEGGPEQANQAPVGMGGGAGVINSDSKRLDAGDGFVLEFD